MVQGGLKKVQGGLEPPLAPHFPRLCFNLSALTTRPSQSDAGEAESQGKKNFLEPFKFNPLFIFLQNFFEKKISIIAIISSVIKGSSSDDTVV